MANRDDENWKAYADGVSSANLSVALNRASVKTSRSALRQEPMPTQKQQTSNQKDAGTNSNPDIDRAK